MVSDVAESVARLAPADPLDRETIETALQRARPNWHLYLAEARQDLEAALTNHKFRLLTGELRLEVLDGERCLLAHEVAVVARLKTVEAILGKMQRFNEPLFNMLDIWGYRVVVSDLDSLDEVVQVVTGLWEQPGREELLLRNGQLQFQWLRDYRKQSHEGLSSATSQGYDEAVHINRRTAFGVVEVQILTADLYARAYVGHGDEAHANFARRRAAELIESRDRHDEQ